MTPKVMQYLNKNVLVSIPALFEDGACRAHKLLGAEPHGLWLQSEELIERLMPADRQGGAPVMAAVFVPFAQIAGVMVVAERATAPPLAANENRKPSAGQNIRTKDKNKGNLPATSNAAKRKK
jgi:hypothetical protein